MSIGFVTISADPDCTKAEEMLESCGMHLALLEDSEIPIPTNDAEMIDHCGYDTNQLLWYCFDF